MLEMQIMSCPLIKIFIYDAFLRKIKVWNLTGSMDESAGRAMRHTNGAKMTIASATASGGGALISKAQNPTA